MSIWGDAQVVVVDRQRRKVGEDAVLDPRAHGRPACLDHPDAKGVRVRWRVDGGQRAKTFELDAWADACRLARDIAFAQERRAPADLDGLPEQTGVPSTSRHGDGRPETVEELVAVMQARVSANAPKTLSDKLHTWSMLVRLAVYADDDIGPAGASVRIEHMTSARARDIVRARATTNHRTPGKAVRQSTVDRFVTHARALFKDAAGETPPLIDSNPFTVVRANQARNKARPDMASGRTAHHLTMPEWRAVADAAGADHRAVILARAAFSARPCEIAGLQAPDLDTHTWTITFRRSLVRVTAEHNPDGRTWAAGPLKGRLEGEVRLHPVPADDVLRAALERELEMGARRRRDRMEYLDKRLKVLRRTEGVDSAAYRSAMGSLEFCEAGPWVFLTPKGAMLDANNFGPRIWQPALRSVLGPTDPRVDMPFYNLRHSGITHRRDVDGMRDEDVARLAGTSTRHIERVYGRDNQHYLDRVRRQMGGGPTQL